MSNVKRAFLIAEYTLAAKRELARQYGMKIWSATDEQLYSYMDSAEQTPALVAAITGLNSL